MIDDERLKNTPMDLETVRDFCARIDVSIARLYVLFDKGLPRVKVSIGGYKQPRVLIPVAAGLAWYEARQRNAHPRNIAVGQKQKDLAIAERQRRERNRERLRAWNPSHLNLTQSQSGVIQ